jgi:hypothetical protein
LRTFFGRHIEPLWVRAHGMWLYTGLTQPTRESAGEQTNAKFDDQIKSILEVGAMDDISPHLTLLHQGVPSTKVSTASWPALMVLTDLVFLPANRLICFCVSFLRALEGSHAFFRFSRNEGQSERKHQLLRPQEVRQFAKEPTRSNTSSRRMWWRQLDCPCRMPP